MNHRFSAVNRLVFIRGNIFNHKNWAAVRLVFIVTDSPSDVVKIENNSCMQATIEIVQFSGTQTQ